MKSLFISTLMFLVFAFKSHAGLIFTLEGTTGSSDYTLTASGEYSNNGFSATSNNSGCCFRLIRDDISVGWWAPTGGWSGAIFASGLPAVTGVTGNILFNFSGDVVTTRTASNIWNSSYVWLPGSINALWPTISSGQNVSMAGSGTINFSSVITFEQLNQGSYTYNTVGTTDTVTYVVRERSDSTDLSSPGALGLILIGFLLVGRSALIKR
ncbi:hypothetical protein [Brumicola blandensis]|uniref:PEP-CTERM sorting domain-containing protein n=1 Tax=Brumicola blandensis TaxID=3075611 RepID=A0AAW8R483_9ALTE|nr:hypothetical protein [Alteromonas sp. W409]MDT0583162.1 hypothetical protein [Alteromonas sp. W409]